VRDSPITVLEADFSDTSQSGKQRIRQIIRRYDIDSIYLTDRAYYSFYYAWLRCEGIRSLVLHDHMPGERSTVPTAKRLLKSCLHRLNLLSCDLYIGVSNFVYNRLITSGCIVPSKCTYVTNGIQPINTNASVARKIRTQFSLPPEAIIVVSTGRATYYKGVDFIIEAAARVITNNWVSDSVYFLHCGDGPDLDAFRSLAVKKGIAERFILTGQRSDIRTILPACDIAVHASHGEAFSLSILEYMSAGLPMIAPDHCGNNEAIIDESTGYLYEPGNLDMFTDRLVELVTRDGLRSRFGSASAERIRQEFDIRNSASNLIAELERAI